MIVSWLSLPIGLNRWSRPLLDWLSRTRTLRAANADLTKQLAEKPRVVVDNVLARADQMLATVTDLETQTRILAARFDRAGI